MIKRIILPVIIFVLTFSACTIFQRGEGYIIDYIPRDSDVPGWNRDMAPVTVEGPEIGSYSADYTGIGIETMAWCTYTSFENRDRLMKVEIIRFNGITDAYSFFSDVSGFSETGTCPDNEFYNANLAILRAGEYIIYVRTEAQHLENPRDLKNFSSISMSYIGDSYSAENLPSIHDVLKRAGASCVLYTRKGIVSAAGINRCYYSMINGENKKYFVFLSERGTNYDCMNLFQKTISKKYIILKADNTQSAFKKDDSGSYIFISVYDRWIYGCWGVTDINDGKSILQNIRNAVEIYSKTAR